jgi:hypothetical protein
MSITAGFRDRKEVRSFHRIRKANSGRILNLIDLSDAAVAAIQTEGKSTNCIFHAKALNYSILAKHNVRENERELFTRNLKVATKVFIPFDPKRLDIGGRSFFIEEQQFKDHLKELVHIDSSLADPHIQHDVKVLETLGHSPTLDPFIVTERLRAEGIVIEPTYFAESYAVTHKTSSDAFQAFKPLLQKALGKVASDEEMSRFIDQVWNVTAATSNNPFLEALMIPRSEWANVIFAWKALIYYDIVSRDSPQRLQRVLNILQGIKPKGRVSKGAHRDLMELKREFARQLYRLHDGSTGYIQLALQKIVNAILSETGASVISDCLRSMAQNITKVGTDVVLFDQITSYFLYMYPKPSMDLVDADELEGQLANLCEIVQLREAAA